MKQEIGIKRAYDPVSPSDGYRVYIDRLWPRGLSHETFIYDWWDKAISPSTQLREWFHQDPDTRWEEFQKKYLDELSVNPAFEELRQAIGSYNKITLLYSSRDPLHNNAVVVEKALTSDIPPKIK